MPSRKSTVIRSIVKDELSTWKWHYESTCLVGQSSSIAGSDKIASFDMDETLIKTKNGGIFAKDANDWVFWHQSVPTKMNQLYDDGFKMVIFTNQLGISKGKTDIKDIQKKMQTIAKEMNIQMQVFVAIGDDKFRKPSTLMWQVLQKNNDNVKINKIKSFYCGDAAGRKNGKHKDFSDSDLKFALNVQVQFKTPENLFLGDKEKVNVKGFNPKLIQQQGVLIEGKKQNKVNFVDKEMVIFVGSPGSGKSTFWNNYMPNYERINRDTLKTKQKCYRAAQQSIVQGKSVVIDNTCPKKQDRKYFIDLAKKHGYKVRCFRFLTNKDICFHNDYQRVANSIRKHLSGKAGSIPIHSWFKYLQEPEKNEGYYEINQVNFIAKFYDNKDKQAYQQFSKK